MPSFNAFLVLGSYTKQAHLGSPTYPIDICSQHIHQDVAPNGRPVTRPYAGELHLTMPPPSDAKLVAWAKNQTQPQDCAIVFRDLDGIVPSLILSLEHAFCVSYSEHFRTDDNSHVSYFCQLSITAGRMSKQGTEFVNSWHP